MTTAEPVLVKDQGLMFPGHDTPRPDVLAAARAYLLARGADDWELDDSLAAPGVAARAWWGGDDIGFVARDHPDATPVTIVNLLPPPSTEGA